ncbi:MAG TPA: HEAT repeat domain-containing protein [Anaerolineales bacterium]|nr:HEAT repeat domain-containing protein [Anaerolineales bacterium]
MRLFKPNIRRLLKKKDTPGLIRALNDSDPDIRWEATGALGEIGDAQAVEPLITAFMQGHVGATAAALVKIGAPSVGPLIEALSDKRAHIRDAATDALVKIGTPAVKPLIAKLGVSLQYVGQAAARALGEIGDAQAVDGLVAALNNDYVCRFSADALVKIGTPSVEPLVAALSDKHTRRTAAQALYKLGWKPGAGQTDEISSVYWIANQQWQKCIAIGAPAVGPLIEALEEERQDVRQAVVNSLDELGWQPGTDEASAIYYVTKKQWHKCVEIGAPAVNTLIAVLHGRDQLACRDAAHALGMIGDARAVQPLIKTLGYDHYHLFPFETAFIREAVVAALGKIGAAQAVEPLILALADEWFGVRRNAAAALGSMGDKRATEPLIHTLQKEKSWSVGLVVYGVLKQTPDVFLSDADVQRLIDSLADEIHSRYSKTSQVGGSLIPISPNDDERPDYVDSDGDWWKWDPPPQTKSDPDIQGIRWLISIIPEELRERVSALSGEAKGLF